MSKTTLMNRAAIRVDETLYPRYSAHKQTATQYTEAMSAGAKFPPLTVDQHGRLIDGRHRLSAYDANKIRQIPVVVVQVGDDAEFFRLGLEANAHHGSRFTAIDYAHMVLVGKKLGITSEEIAKLVNITPGFLEEATKGWFALDGDRQPVPIKRTIRHMAGKKLTAEQQEANRRLSGMNPMFYMNQVKMLCDADLLNREDDNVLALLRELHTSITDYLRGVEKRGKQRRKAA